jgi:hypothetical protein
MLNIRIFLARLWIFMNFNDMIMDYIELINMSFNNVEIINNLV